jgi:hypothetical protein
MNTDDLFRELEPPPGGTEAFARRLDETAEERPPRRARALGMAAIAAVALVAAILLARKPDDAPPVLVADEPPAGDVYDAPELDRLLGRTSTPAGLMVMVNMETANVSEIETTNEKVRIYQIN